MGSSYRVGRMVGIITDFGTTDPYVGIMKGVMLGIDPDLRFIDITNQIQPQNILSTSYVLYSSWRYMPSGTVFLVVVDPGVGSDRREILAKGQDRFIVCPDNGIVSLLIHMGVQLDCHRADARLLAELSESESWSNTFHGRDLFAPLAARVAAEGYGSIQGESVSPVLLPDVKTTATKAGTGKDGNEAIILSGNVLHIDTFGNCITSIHLKDLHKAQKSLSFSENSKLNDTIAVNVGGMTIQPLLSMYSEVAPGQPVAYIGSAGFLEIAVREGDARRELGITYQDPVDVTFSP